MAGPTYLVRNEPDPDYEYHCDALASYFPDAIEIDFPAGERFDPAAAGAVVLSGSTAGVYEADDRPWIADLEALVRELVEREIPTLGVCFGHQVVNAALGGTVEAVGFEVRVVEADLDDDPLFEGVAPAVPSLHGDEVVETGEGMVLIGSAEHAPIYCTRHERAPVWTVQFHPEIGANHRERLAEDFDFDPEESFEAVSATALFENFRALAAERSPVRATDP